MSDNKTTVEITPLSSIPNPYLPPKAAIDNAITTDDDELLKAFVQNRYDYHYRNSWFKKGQPHILNSASTPTVAKLSFNVSALILGISWLCYRKMYGYALCVVLLYSLDIAVMHLIGPKAYNNAIDTMVLFVLPLLLGMFGNYLYYLHTCAAINKAKAKTEDNIELVYFLQQKGGTSFFAALVGTVLISAMIFALYYILAPAWYWQG